MLFSFHGTEALEASIELVEGGVLVKQGSQASLKTKPHFEIHCASYATKRRELIESEVLKDDGVRFVFSQDQYFASTSAAASVVAGQNQNADHWVAANGDNLGDLLRAIRNKQERIL
ncbi:DUF4357 domain-containing protein [Candidatus Nitrotoga fabula]|uniref:DUF4357 domain-containing protein n=1 Tax=Candidatus Nitrotoga fabula TaxID=2182327 RepID=A0A916BE82_9PROT|nr:DUF4357 domain-containing protein [Candidatus Nitrotoga fabula]CAE6715511.1 hypothetical protein NTGZN8_260002 [Candidatus Nitrotoga fabula]